MRAEMGMPDGPPNLASASALVLRSPLTSHACWALANSQEAIAWGHGAGQQEVFLQTAQEPGLPMRAVAKGGPRDSPGCARTRLQQHCWKLHRGSHAPQNCEVWYFKPSVLKGYRVQKLWRQSPWVWILALPQPEQITSALPALDFSSLLGEANK